MKNQNTCNGNLHSEKAKKKAAHFSLFQKAFFLFGFLISGGLLSAQTIQLGSGTATNSYLPLYYLYDYNYTQTIYTAAELNTAGAPSSSAISITKIRYKPTVTQYTDFWKSWTVYMGNTTKEGFTSTTDWISAGSLTQVFNGDIDVQIIGNNWFEITLATPFNWDGVSNIVVAIDENTLGYGDNPMWSAYTLAPSTGNKAIYKYQDNINIDPNAPPTASSRSNTVAQIQFDMAILSPCSGTPSLDSISAVDSICPSVSFSLNGTPILESGIEYQWQSTATGAGNWTDIIGATNPSYNMTSGIVSSSDYRLIATCISSNQADTSNVITVVVNDPLNCYCTPTYSYGCSSDNIDDFILAGDSIIGINNLNTPCALAYYSDYTSMVAYLTAGNTYSGTVTTSYSSASENMRIWIDYNRNGQFEASESIATLANQSSSSPGTFSFTLPPLLANGTYRLRVRSVYSEDPNNIDPCNNYAFGETHDYTVEITGGCTDPIVDIGGAQSLCDGDTLILDAGNTGLDFLWNDNSTNQTLEVTTAGTYTVTVSEGFCSTTDTAEVSIAGIPTADSILATVQNECEFEFSVENAANITEYIWNFGDGSATETGAVATHTYASNSNYLVSLTMKNDCGDSSIITKTVECTGVGISNVNLDKNTINLYPNPSSDFITLESNASLSIKNISIFNVLGQEVYKNSSPNNVKHQINVSIMSSGIYTVHIQTNEGVITKKFEIIK